MKYLLLMWTEDLPESREHAEGFGTEADYQAWTDYEARLRENGTYVDSGDLQPARTARLVRPDIGAGDAASGATGALRVSGYYVIEVPDEQAAIDVAKGMPLYGTVEVRGVVDYSAGDWEQ